MSPQGVLPPAEIALTCETLRALPGDSDVALALPLSSKTFVTHTATPLLTDVVVHGCGLTATRLRGR